MKKTLYFWAILPMLLFSGVLNAQMDNLANLSAKWIRSTVRNATLDGGADMVNFNPAGLALLNDGIYLSLSNQTMFRHPQHSFNLGMGEKTYEQDGMDPFVPMFYAAYKKNKIAVSSGMYISGGGGSAKYPNGSVNTTLLGYSMIPSINLGYGTDYTTIKDENLKGSSFYLTVPLALSYAITDKISVSAGARYVHGINNTKAGLTFTGGLASDYVLNVDYKTTANGVGGVFGVNYKVTEKLNMAIHYETKVKLDFKADVKEGTYELVEDGSKSRRDLPAVLNTGISYNITDNFIAAADFNWYFQKNADWGTMTDPRNAHEKEVSKVAGDVYTANLGFFYRINKLQLSAGGSYTAFKYDDMELYYTNMGVYETIKYDNLSIGLGTGYKVSEKVEIDLGIARTIWKDKTVQSILGNIPVELEDKSYVIALGVDFRL
jgi:long-chain fatty acid transport protein